jgi:hypothetical protein
MSAGITILQRIAAHFCVMAEFAQLFRSDRQSRKTSLRAQGNGQSTPPHEEAQLSGGGVVWVATAARKTQLGRLLNSVVVQQDWKPGAASAISRRYRFSRPPSAKAPAKGVDPLGVFLPPWAYARMRVKQQRIKATGSVADVQLAVHLIHDCAVCNKKPSWMPICVGTTM